MPFQAKHAAVALLLLLGGCAAPSARNAARPAAAPVYSTLGLETVMGRTAAALQAQFGRADLDIQEGTARKLQFSSAICVLDAYLYPPAAGAGTAVVTHVDARLPDGRDIDRASCVAALSRRQEAR